MPQDPLLLARLRQAAADCFPQLVEKGMFGGIGFFAGGNYAFGASDTLVVRVGPAQYESALAQRHVREMDITGRSMKGWVFVDNPGIASDDALLEWLQLGVDFASSLPPK